jgi:YbbR domain-containing protein
MKSSFFKKTENPEDKKGIRLNRSMVTFFICLMGSAFFWLLLSLSKEYSITLSFPVAYHNVPKDRVISNHLPESIDIEIRAKGFNLLSYKFYSARETISIDLKDARPLESRNHSFLLTNLRTDKITAQFSNSIRIIKISPDTIFLNFNKKVTKRVRVVPKIKVECAEEFQLTDSVHLDPEYIDISGAADVLEHVDSITTMPMVLRNVNKPMLVKIALAKTSTLKYTEYSVPTVDAIINVAKFTEASIELPVEVENLPAGYSLKTFPDKVMVKYNVAFENYEKVNASQFRLIVDYNKVEQGSNKLKLQLVQHPSTVRAVKLQTEKVEFIIRK